MCTWEAEKPQCEGGGGGARKRRDLLKTGARPPPPPRSPPRRPPRRRCNRVAGQHAGSGAATRLSWARAGQDEKGKIGRRGFWKKEGKKEGGTRPPPSRLSAAKDLALRFTFHTFESCTSLRSRAMSPESSSRIFFLNDAPNGTCAVQNLQRRAPAGMMDRHCENRREKGEVRKNRRNARGILIAPAFLSLPSHLGARARGRLGVERLQQVHEGQDDKEVDDEADDDEAGKRERKRGRRGGGWWLVVKIARSSPPSTLFHASPHPSHLISALMNRPYVNCDPLSVK